MENKEKRKTYHNKVKEVSTCSEVCRQIVWKSADCSSPSPGLERGEERRGEDVLDLDPDHYEL